MNHLHDAIIQDAGTFTSFKKENRESENKKESRKWAIIRKRLRQFFIIVVEEEERRIGNTCR